MNEGVPCADVHVIPIQLGFSLTVGIVDFRFHKDRTEGPLHIGRKRPDFGFVIAIAVEICEVLGCVVHELNLETGNTAVPLVLAINAVVVAVAVVDAAVAHDVGIVACAVGFNLLLEECADFPGAVLGGEADGVRIIAVAGETGSPFVLGLTTYVKLTEGDGKADPGAVKADVVVVGIFAVGILAIHSRAHIAVLAPTSLEGVKAGVQGQPFGDLEGRCNTQPLSINAGC
ncbi:MAG: hypothetical protein A4E69_01679 [Syntrophus sp. PtaB.Bin138]|nr:MAG: hypothetical protein A4E69_01679 [Syntrophus sp. PtaB.Bin138]